jgi:hypothetical protein
MNKLLSAFLLLLATWAVASCSSTRRGISATPPSDSLTHTAGDSIVQPDTAALVRFGPVGPMPDSAPGQSEETRPATTTATTPLANAALLVALLPHAMPDATWRTFSGRAKVHFEGGGDSHDFSANIRMEQGKGIWISATAVLNFEVARLLITPDTVWLLDRLSRSVTALPFSQIGTLLPLQTDFASLQSLITGGPLQTMVSTRQALDTGAFFLLLGAAPNLVQALQFSKVDTSLNLQYIATGASNMLCEYGAHTRLSGHRFSAKRNLRLSDRGNEFGLTMEFQKATFDETVELPFSIPDSYQRK